jgi:3-oxoadipate CoA-transferase alpha subunit
LYKSGEIELELLPQGNLTEKVRAAGAGIGAFYTPIGVGTLLGKDKEQKMINGKLHQLEYPLFADVALISAKTADRWGNLIYSTTARNFGPSMAMAGKVTAVEVLNIVELGQLDPEVIITPGIFVDKVVKVTR